MQHLMPVLSFLGQAQRLGYNYEKTLFIELSFIALILYRIIQKTYNLISDKKPVLPSDLKSVLNVLSLSK